MTGDKTGVSRPYRVMYVRQWSTIRGTYVTLPRPRCAAGTYTTRERAGKSMSPWWAEVAGAYVEGPK